VLWRKFLAGRISSQPWPTKHATTGRFFGRAGGRWRLVEGVTGGGMMVFFSRSRRLTGPGCGPAVPTRVWGPVVNFALANQCLMPREPNRVTQILPKWGERGHYLLLVAGSESAPVEEHWNWELTKQHLTLRLGSRGR